MIKERIRLKLRFWLGIVSNVLIVRNFLGEEAMNDDECIRIVIRDLGNEAEWQREEEKIPTMNTLTLPIFASDISVAPHDYEKGSSRYFNETKYTLTSAAVLCGTGLRDLRPS
jgi:hypothetical protein